MLRIVCLLLVASWTSAADTPELKVVAGKSLPKGCTLELNAHAGKQNIAILDLTKPVKLPHAGPYDVIVNAKGQLPIRILTKWKPVAELKLSDHVGTVFVRGDEFPRAERIVITSGDDAGPGEKGHKPIQSASDYKQDMVVLPGVYTVWVVPANGARAQKIAEKIRVLAGRETRVE